MDYHQNARLTFHSRELLAKLVVEQGYTQQAAARAFHVSAKTAGKWVRRYRQQGRTGLKDLSSRPHGSSRLQAWAQTQDRRRRRGSAPPVAARATRLDAGRVAGQARTAGRGEDS